MLMGTCTVKGDCGSQKYFELYRCEERFHEIDSLAMQIAVGSMGTFSAFEVAT